MASPVYVFSSNAQAGTGAQPSYSGQRLLVLYPCIFFLFETPSRVHPATLILSHSSFSLGCTMTPEQPSDFPQSGGRLAVAPAAVTHTHSRCAAAMIGATPVRGTVYREEMLPERPKPLAPAVPAMQEQTARACLCLGGGGNSQRGNMAWLWRP